MEIPKLQFSLRGFSEVMGHRVFTFEGVAPDRTRALFTIRANLALSRRYGIQLQELPLLCQATLEVRQEGWDKRTFVYGEEHMRTHALEAAARSAAAKQRKPPRRPVSPQVGIGWRAPQQ